MRYFWVLDLLRFLAAAMVVMFHFSTFGPAFGTLAPGEGPLGWLSPFAWFGWVGVQIFFVISGFIICASAENSNAVTFLQKRALRILPVLWISTLAAFAVRVAMGEDFDALVTIFFKTILLSPKGPYMDGVVWTLVVEVIFYLCVAASLALTRHLQDRSRALFVLALAIGAASSAFNICHLLAANIQHWPFPVDPDLFRWFGFDVMLLRHGVFFALGILLYLRYRQCLPRAARPALVVFSLVCMVQINFLVGAQHNALLPIAIWIAATAAMYFGAIFGERPVSADIQKVMRPIGLMTYPLYLNHYILGQALLPMASTLIAGPVALFLTVSAILLLNAWLIAAIPEPWIQGYGRKLLQGRHQAEASRLSG